MPSEPTASSGRDWTAFANRLRKNLKHWRKWAMRRDIECFRVYDRDIPEFPCALDLYGTHAHLQVFQRGARALGDLEDETERLTAVLCETTGLPPEQVALKTRQRQSGSQQYQRSLYTGQDLVVREGGLQFIVNLTTYLDTGLFLDHRTTRALVREQAQGKRFLNLFAYTGSFTVYAAAGGARETLSVDLSNTYQDWTRRNLLQNGLDGPNHELLRGDVFEYLEQARRQRQRFGLIVLDPPSFSNSARMQATLDVQRDQQQLLDGCMELLTPGGRLYFSTNLRSFKLDEGLAARHGLSEITDRTVPEDFRRHRPHRCWIAQLPI